MNLTTPDTFGATLRRVQRVGLGAAAAGTLGAVIGLLVSSSAFFQGYLTAFVFWSGLSLGCLSLLLLHHLVLGGWGFVTQRILEAGTLTIGLVAVLFVPIIFGLQDLYIWTRPEIVAEESVLQAKEPYLNVPLFLLRAVLYFGAWCTLAYWLRRWSVRLDQTDDPAFATRMRRYAAGGLIAHVLLVTFASLDWIMSLDPRWFSTVFGWMLMVSQTLGALSVVILVLAATRHTPPLAAYVRVRHFHDYGNLVLTFVILWAYLMYAQFFIIWSGNLPEEVLWYVERQHGVWGWINPFIVIFGFAVPFFVLLARRSKRSVRHLATLAAFILAVQVVYTAWLVLPTFSPVGIHTYWIAGVIFVGMGGAWAAVFAWCLGRQPLVPVHDPRFAAILSHPSTAEPES